jgi:hypothetical protein
MEAKMAKDETKAVEATTATTAGGRAIMLKVDGKDTRRVDYIRDQWKAGQSRSQIKAKLKELGHEVPYQIVFQATKGIEGGPKSEAKAA